MSTVEIPKGAWSERLNQFTTIHEGWLVSVDTLGDLGAQTVIHNLPLLGVSANRPNHDGTIAISVARSATEHVTHMIEAVERIYIEITNDGAEAAMAMESAGGAKTILRFRATALPETVDGIVPPR